MSAASSLDQGAKLDPQATRRLIESYTPIDVVSAEFKDIALRLIDRAPDLLPIDTIMTPICPTI